MATTLTISKVTGALPFVRGERTDGLVIGFCDIVTDASYPTGGEALAAAEVDANLVELYGIICLSVSGTNAAKAYYVAYDKENAKLLIFDEAGETGSTSDHSDAVLHCMYFGIG